MVSYYDNSTSLLKYPAVVRKGMTNKTYIKDDTSTVNYCNRCKIIVDDIDVCATHIESHCVNCCNQMTIDMYEDRMESYNDLD